MNGRGALGRFGERVAARWLCDLGMTILERNWRCRAAGAAGVAGVAGEIDIVAREEGREGALVVCEVKTRRATSYQQPMAGLAPRQSRRLRELAQRWLCERWLVEHGAPPAGGVRIDLVGIVLPLRGGPVVEHVRGVA
ncbi:YraN family protein [Streptomyces sp. 4N509B]|uniref:YraN family protein n=1 Tax=Streptomyces sp. 4N509B TaxID=3457413 RepID=UPI003FD6695B